MITGWVSNRWGSKRETFGRRHQTRTMLAKQMSDQYGTHLDCPHYHGAAKGQCKLRPRTTRQTTLNNATQWFMGRQ